MGDSKFIEVYVCGKLSMKFWY